MDQPIEEVDFWTIIKALGGLTVVVSAVIGFLSYLVQSRLLDKWRTADQLEIEKLKGTIDRNNSVLNTIISNSTSETILSRRIEAIERIWEFVVKTKQGIPATVYTPLAILTDDEIIRIENLKKLSNGTIEGLPLHETMAKNILFGSIEKYRFIVPQQLWLLTFAYQAAVNRTVYMIIDGVQKGKYTYWKHDAHHNNILKSALTKEEIEFIYGMKIQSFDMLINLFHQKILNEVNKILTGESVTEDNIKTAQKYTELLKIV